MLSVSPGEIPESLKSNRFSNKVEVRGFCKDAFAHVGEYGFHRFACGGLRVKGNSGITVQPDEAI